MSHSWKCNSLVRHTQMDTNLQKWPTTVRWAGTYLKIIFLKLYVACWPPIVVTVNDFFKCVFASIFARKDQKLRINPIMAGGTIKWNVATAHAVCDDGFLFCFYFYLFFVYLFFNLALIIFLVACWLAKVQQFSCWLQTHGHNYICKFFAQVFCILFCFGNVELTPVCH